MSSRRLAVWCSLLDYAQVWICPYSPVLWGTSSQTQNLRLEMRPVSQSQCITFSWQLNKGRRIYKKDVYWFLTQCPLSTLKLLLELWGSGYHTYSTHIGATVLKQVTQVRVRSAVSQSYSCTYSLSCFSLYLSKKKKNGRSLLQNQFLNQIFCLFFQYRNIDTIFRKKYSEP